MRRYDYKPFGYRRRRSHSFAIITVASFVIVLAAIWTALMYLWNYLEAYEGHNPDTAIQEYIAIYKNKDYDAIAKSCGFKYDYFNDADAFAAYMTDSFGDLSNAKATRIANDGEKLRYNLKNGDKLVTVLTVTPNGNRNRYGLEGWAIAATQGGHDGKHSAKVCVPIGAQALIDGKPMSEELLMADSFGVHEYDDLDDEALIPRFATYEVKGLLNVPKIGAAMNGENFAITEKAGTHYALPAPDETQLATIKARVEEIAVKYCLYAIQDIKYAELEPYLVKESSYARAIKDFENKWLTEHTFSYDAVKFGDIIQYDGDHVVINISFSYHLKLKYSTKDYDVHYKMSLLRQEGTWLLAGMKVS